MNPLLFILIGCLFIILFIFITLKSVKISDLVRKVFYYAFGIAGGLMLVIGVILLLLR